MDIESLVKNIFFEALPNLLEFDFSWNKEQQDYENWDSFTQLNLITLAEAKFNISFTLDEAIKIKSAADLLEYIRSHLS